MSSNVSFTKENLDGYLKELAKEYRKMNGNQTPAEIILIGGASILVNYGFREMTYDMDAIIHASSSMKDAINRVGNRMGLPNGWLNTDFQNTASYTPKLVQYSKYYKIFSNIVKVRTISEEYLVSMKLMAGRQYKNDLSDVVGIILEQKNKDNPISLEDIKRATCELYGEYEKIPERSREFIETALNSTELEAFYLKCREDELANKDVLLEFQEGYLGVLNENNLSDILRIAREKKLV